jgi:hypothetical protein
MSDAKYVPPEAIIADLTMGLCQSRAALRALARRKKWEPSIDDCRAIAERQVEHLKRCGVVGVTRRIAPTHGMRPGEAEPPAPSEHPTWRPRPAGKD